MAKKHRQFRQFGLYHILQRGHNKSFIFKDPLDKITFFEIIKTAQIQMPFNLIYYVIMDNHYHFLIEMLDHDISNIMHKINLNYSRYYNTKNGRLGTIYGGTYKAKEVTNTRYFTQLIGYFAHNPVRAEIVKTPSEYKWCAHYEIIQNKSGLAQIGRLFELIDGSQKRAREFYMEMIKEGVNPENENKAADAFVNPTIIVRSETLEATLMRCLDGQENTYNQLFSKDRSLERSELRRKCARYASEAGFTSEEIASIYGTSSRAVRYLLGE